MKELICIVCPRGCRLRVEEDSGCAVTGNACPRGADYGKRELTHPTRVITSTVRCAGGMYPRCPVKTSGPIPKERICEAGALLDGVTLEAPVRLGQAAVKNVCGTGVDFVATRGMPRADEAAGGASHG